MNILFAILYTVGLYLSVKGVLIGTNILLGLLGFHVFAVATVTLLAILTDIDFERNKTGIDTLVNIVLQSFIGISAYHLYTMGYEYFAGIVSLALIIAVISNIGAYLTQKNEG